MTALAGAGRLGVGSACFGSPAFEPGKAEMLEPRKSSRAGVAPRPRGFAVGVPRSSRGALDRPALAALVVVRGLSGSGKTDVLHALAARGEQVLDLEALAVHRGSAFGRIGLAAPPPPRRAFAAAVAAVVAGADPARALWTEEEGDFLGRASVPGWLTAAAATAVAVDLRAPRPARVARIAAAYADARPADLLAALTRCAPRLGAGVAAAAGARIEAGDYAGAVAILLPAYDRAYRHRAARCIPAAASFEVGGLTPAAVAARLRGWARCHDR